MLPEYKNAAVALVNPKYPFNVGNAIRLCSCFEIPTLMWSGNRVPLPTEWKDHEELREYRLPREERMKGYAEVELIRTDLFKEKIKAGNYTPVAVEVREEAEILFEFNHPKNPMYIFGAEDGGLNSNILQHCHRFLTIPSAFCLNLSNAVCAVLYSRSQQIYNETGYKILLKEQRGFIKSLV